MNYLTMSKQRYFLLLLAISTLFGQSELPLPATNLPEFIRQDSIYIFLPDTINNQHEESGSHKAHLIRKAGLGIFLLSGLISIHYQTEANNTYNQYLRTGDPRQMDPLFKRTAQLDRQAGWSYVGMEAGILLFIYSYYE